MRKRPGSKAADRLLHDGVEAAELYALLPEEVQAMVQQSMMRMGAAENLEGMIEDYTDPEI